MGEPNVLLVRFQPRPLIFMNYRQQRRERRRQKKAESAKEKYEERRRYRPCNRGCGGMMSWCSCCECYSHYCCVDYGTCLCS